MEHGFSPSESTEGLRNRRNFVGEVDEDESNTDEDEFDTDDDGEPPSIPYRESSESSEDQEEDDESSEPVRRFRQEIIDEELPEPERRFGINSDLVSEMESDYGADNEDLDLLAEREFLEENREEVRDLLEWMPSDNSVEDNGGETEDQGELLERNNDGLGEAMENLNGDLGDGVERNNRDQRDGLNINNNDRQRPIRNQTRLAFDINV